MSAPQPIALSTDRDAWLAARRAGVTATDVAKVAGAASLRRILADKRGELASFRNAAMDHGTRREPRIAEWVESQSAQGRFGSGRLIPSVGLFAHPEHPEHLATPDGRSEDWDFFQELVEIKTTNKPWRSIPRNYLRQVWWQQYVLGADRTLVVWEQHDGFVPVDMEPQFAWVKRDQQEIDDLLVKAGQLLEYMSGELPAVDPTTDELITRYLAAKQSRDERNAELEQLEEQIRAATGGKPATVLGTTGDLTITAPTRQVRFDQKRFRERAPKTYARYQHEIPIAGRFTVTAVKTPTPEESAA